MKKRIWLTFFLIPIGLSPLITLYNSKNIKSVNNDNMFSNEKSVKNQDLVKAFERITTSIRFFKMTNVSDLSVTQDEIKNIYAWIMNNLTPLFPYLPPPQRSMPGNFFGQNEHWDGTVDPRPKENDLNKTVEVSLQMAEQMFKILRYLPNTNNQNDYIYWMYSFIANWISYSSKGLDNKLFLNGLINKKGVCEAYAKMSQFFFNTFNVDAVYQTGNLKSGEAAGDHIWNKFKIGEQWFNFDATSAATFDKAYYLLPLGDFLSFSDSDFPSKREQYPTWYESEKVADFNTASLANLVPYRRNLPYKKVVYNNKWYYFDFNSREIVESNIDGSDKIVIRKVNRTANINYKSADIVYLVGNKLYWVDVNEENKIVISEFDLQTRQTNLNYHIFDFPTGSSVTSTKLDNLNELSVTIYHSETGTKSQIIKVNESYNFFENNKTEFSIRALASILSLWFMQFEIGSDIGQFKNEELYLKHQDILIKGLTATKYNENLYNQLINFKQNVEKDLNKVAVPNFDIEIDNSKTVSEYDNLVIKPTITIENATNPQITYQWQQSSNGTDWTNIDGQTNKNLTINNITKEWNNKKVKVIMNIVNNGETNTINSNECIITITDPNIPNITLDYFPKKSEWNVGDQVTFKSNQNLNNIILFKKQSSIVNEVTRITSDPNTASYLVKKEDLLNEVEFYIEANFFDTKIKSNSITINFMPKISQSINGIENKNEINEMDVENTFTLSINDDLDNLQYQWYYDENYFEKIGQSDDLSSITFKVIKNDNVPKAINCFIIDTSGKNFQKTISYTITFKNQTPPIIPPNPDNIDKTNNQNNSLPIIVGVSVGATILLITIITLIIIIRKRRRF